MENETAIFKIGHSGLSETKIPTYSEMEANGEKVFLVDAAGVNDCCLSDEFGNQTAIKNVLKDCKGFKLCLLMHSSINLNKYGDFIKLVTVF